jgi:hypothetical protein
MAKYIRKEPDGKGGFRYIYSGGGHVIDLGKRGQKSHEYHKIANEASSKANKKGDPKSHGQAMTEHQVAAIHFRNRSTGHILRESGAKSENQAKIHRVLTDEMNNLSRHHAREAKKHEKAWLKPFREKIMGQTKKSILGLFVRSDSELLKAGKFIKKVPDGRGGWKYVYPSDKFGRTGAKRALQASHLAEKAGKEAGKHDVSAALRGEKLRNAATAHKEAQRAHSIASEHHKKIGNKDETKHHDNMAFEHGQNLRKLKGRLAKQGRIS